jgi:hypothetical protein
MSAGERRRLRATGLPHQCRAVARAQAERLNATLGTVPLRKPVDGEIDTTSGFGVRIDPFIGRRQCTPPSISVAIPATRSG